MIIVRIFLFFVVVLAGTAAAQSIDSGSITGRVSHAGAGTYLSSVRVSIEGTSIESYTTTEGRYVLSGIPPGVVQVRLSYSGFESQFAQVIVQSGQTAVRDFELAGIDGGTSGQVLKLDAFTVEARELSAQAAALQEQRTAPNIKNVVAFEEFGDLGDGNPGDFLKFVPGIQMEVGTGSPSEPMIRGMPASGTVVTIDGVEYPTDTPGTRGPSFSTMNTSNLDRIEMTKVPTPDLPANAVGGSINLVSKSGFSRRDPQFNYSVYGLITSKEPITSLGREMFDRGGSDSTTRGSNVQPGFDFTYTKPINSSLAVSVSGGRNIRRDDKDALTATWNRIAFIQTQSGEAAQIAYRERNALAARIDWKPSMSHTVFANFQFTSDDLSSRIHTHTQSYGAGATGGEHFTQGAATAVGSTTLSTTSRDQLKATWHTSLGHRFENHGWKIESTLARAHSRRRTVSAEDGHDYFGTTSATLSNLILRGEGFARLKDGVPAVVTGTRGGVPIDVTDGQLYTLNTVSSPVEPRMRNDITTVKFNASRELSLPFTARLMVGVDLSRNEREINAETRTWNFRPTFAANSPERLVGSYDLINWPYSDERSFNNGDRVRWVDPRKAYALYKANPSWFVLNDAAYHISQVNGAQRLEESIYAGFLRTDFKFIENRLWIVAGVRYERTDDEGVGGLNDIRATYQQDSQGNLIRNAAGQPIRVSGDALTLARLQYTALGSRDKKNYDGYYPSINTSYALTENFVARAAYARTIGRPALNFIIPSSSIADPSAAETARTITVSNTGLKPWTANNYDLSFEAYGIKGATITLSLFRKDISDFFVTTRSDATAEVLANMGLSDDYLDYDVITTTNSADAVALSGLEWSWRQSLKPFSTLPSWLRGVQVWANSTHLRVKGEGRDNFSNYSPRIVNWGVSYASARFLLKYNVSRMGRWVGTPNAASSTLPAGTYNGEDLRMIQDGSIEYRFHKNFAVYASVRNLASAPRPLITYSPDLPAYVLPRGYTYYGALWTMGVKGTF